MQLRLLDKQSETADVTSFIFEKPENFAFQAGQFLRWLLPHPNPDDRGTQRFFTISAAPNEPFLMITTRFAKESSSFKKALENLQIGDFIQAEGPNGDFTYPENNPPAIFIAGGIGITPFRSILKNSDQGGTNPPITLIYANRNSQIVFKKLFDDIQLKNSAFRKIYVLDQVEPGWTGPVGKIDAKFIQSYIPNYQDTNLIYYVSGPKLMVQGVSDMLTKLGINPEKIKTDFFPGYQSSL